LPQAVKNTFISNALTWPDELRDPGWSVVDLEALRRFDEPALFTTGTASASFFPPIVERIAAVLPRARLVTYQGTGHVPHATHPNAYLEVVLPFLREALLALTLIRNPSDRSARILPVTK
jgi:pimeloyl-ACP methyl ester carboxylesterase